jgi:hypothetical protein
MWERGGWVRVASCCLRSPAPPPRLPRFPGARCSILWARPLVTVDGAPPEALTKPQFHALASVADRDGGGVKWRLMAHLLTASDADYGALERARDAVAVHMKELRVAEALFPPPSMPGGAGAPGGGAAPFPMAGSAAPRRAWHHALAAAAELTGRPGGRITPREVYDALCGSAAVGVALDLPTVEDAVLGLMGETEGSVSRGVWGWGEGGEVMPASGCSSSAHCNAARRGTYRKRTVTARWPLPW